MRNGGIFAAKVFHKHLEIVSERSELWAMQVLNHPGIVRCYDAVAEGDRFVMIYEDCNGGTLRDLVRENPNGLPLERFRQIASQLIGALAFVHSRGLFHGDLKPTNVMFADSARRTVRIIDFGMSGAAKRRHMRGGTPEFQAPEIWHGRAVDPQAADVWALGALFCVLVQGKSPWTGASDEDRGRQILAHDYTLDCRWPGLAEVIGRMLAPEASRPTMSSLQRMALFAPRGGAPI